MSLRLRETYKVQFDRVDFTGKMTLNGLCSYMQMIAANHASKLGFNYYKNSEEPEYYWILSRAKYVVETYPKWEDEVQIETYPGGYEKLFAVRLFDIYKQNQKVGHIIGDYVLMDVKKHRPAKIKGATGALSFLDFPYEGESLEKIKVPTQDSIRTEVRKAYYSEMDLNGHMNNAHYIRWSVDMLSLDIFEAYEIASFEINYNTSITCDTKVVLQLILEDEKTYVVTGNSLDGTENYFIAKMVLEKIKK